MLEEILNAFDPPAFFTTAPLWIAFTLPGAAMGIPTVAIGLIAMSTHERTKDKDIDHDLRAVLGACIISLCIVTAVVANIAAVCICNGAVLNPALKAHGVTEPFPVMLANFVAFITNTVGFFVVVLAGFAARRAVKRREDRKETRRKYLEAPAVKSYNPRYPTNSYAPRSCSPGRPGEPGNETQPFARRAALST